MIHTCLHKRTYVPTRIYFILNVEKIDFAFGSCKENECEIYGVPQGSFVGPVVV